MIGGEPRDERRARIRRRARSADGTEVSVSRRIEVAVPTVVDGTSQRSVETVVRNLLELGARFFGLGDIAAFGDQLVKQPLCDRFSVSRPLPGASCRIDIARRGGRFGS